MKNNLTVIIPFYNGYRTIHQLIDSIPISIPIVIVDDLSTEPLQLNKHNVTVIRAEEKGYFTGACNLGIKNTFTDVLILNQDIQLKGNLWLDVIYKNRSRYAMIGESIKGVHPAWKNGYIQGTFMYLRRDAIEKVGLLNEWDYPLWGSTCEWQVRACRENFEVLPLKEISGFIHDRPGRFGTAITQVLNEHPELRERMIRTPPEISIIVPCHNYGRYLPDLVNSFVGGETCLGVMPQQSFASFEIIIVNDASDDDTAEWGERVRNEWKGIHIVTTPKQLGTASAINYGISRSRGRYITVLGSDDMRAPGSLDVLYREQIKNKHSFIYDDILCFADGVLRPDIQVGVRDYDFERMLYKNHVHAGIMFPRTAWEETGGYPKEFDDGREDWAMNVSLGIKGYCGIHIKNIGYWYRREKQNRTLRNTTAKHQVEFLGKLVKLYPDIYKGARPMGCCGKGKISVQPQKKSTIIAKQSLKIAGEEGLAAIEYLGGNWGNASFYGAITGSRYVASKKVATLAVDVRDLRTGINNKPGLLELRENGKPLFRLYERPPEPKVQVEEPVQPVINAGEYSLAQIKAMDMSDDLRNQLLASEQSGKKRKSVIEYLSH